MEEWQRKVIEDKQKDRASRNTSKEMLATYSGSAGIKEDDLKLKLMREEHRKKQREAKSAMAKYKKKELSQDDVKLRAYREEQRRLQEDAERANHNYKKTELSEDDLKLRAYRDEQRRLQEDAERANHNYKKTELSEDDLKLRALREEERKKQQEAEKMWRAFQNNDVKTEKRAERQDVTHPPVESLEQDDTLANITAGSVSELAAALKHASPPRKLDNTRRRKPPSGTNNMSYSYDEGDDDDTTNNNNDSASGLVADPCPDSPRRGIVAAAAAQFSGSSTGLNDYSISQRSVGSRGGGGMVASDAADQPTEHTDFDFSANQEVEEAPALTSEQPAAGDSSTADAKEDGEEPPSESQAVEDPEQEPSEKPLEEEPPLESVEEPAAAISDKEEETIVDEPAVVEKEEPVVEEPPVTEPTPVVEEEPMTTTVPVPVVDETTKENEKAEKTVQELAAMMSVKEVEVTSEPVVKKPPKKKAIEVPVQPAAYTQPSEDSKVVTREQYIDAQSGEEKKLEVNDDILHVLDDAEETKPLVGQTSKVRLDVLFSFGLLTTSKKPSFTNYLLAVEDIVQRLLIDKPDVAKFVSYDKEFGPFVQEYNQDGT
jgi:hypothetical protein